MPIWIIQNCNLEPAKTFLCSFDISSLFINVPLNETIEICADALYRGHLDCPPIPEDTFRELMLIATRGVEFSFNNQMYKQLDGVAMGSPLGPALANIFVGFHESRLFDNAVKPGIYFRFVDDTFAIFGSELDCDHFKGKLNLLHPALKFTVEREQNNSLNFLDVLVEKDGTGFLTSVYRKPTFTCQYIRCNSFSPKTRKISLIKTLVHRTLVICSKTKLDSELDKIKQLPIENGYPADVLLSCINQKLANQIVFSYRVIIVMTKVPADPMVDIFLSILLLHHSRAYFIMGIHQYVKHSWSLFANCLVEIYGGIREEKSQQNFQSKVCSLAN